MTRPQPSVRSYSSAPGTHEEGSVRSSRYAVNAVSRRLANDSLTAGLVLALLLALTLPSAGIIVGHSIFTRLSAHATFFIAGLRLRVEEVRDLTAAFKSFAWGIFSVLLLTPCIGSLVVRAFSCHQRELSMGATILVCMPAAVSSSASLTIQAGGNLALSVLLAVTCHSLSVFTIPFLLQRFTALDVYSGLHATSLIQRLAATTLLPLLVGQGCYAASPSVRKAVQAHEHALTFATNTLVVLTPWMYLSHSSQSGVLFQVLPADIARALAVSMLLPLIFFAVNYYAASSLGLAPDYVKSLTIVASSKTLPVAVAVLGMLPPSLGDRGLLTLPAILIYFAHILLCSLVTRFWGDRAEALAAYSKHSV